MSRQFFNMLLANQKVHKDPEDVIVFTASEIFEKKWYSVNQSADSCKIWSDPTLTTTIDGKKYIEFCPKSSDLETNKGDGIYIDVSRYQSLDFKFRDYRYIRIGYKTTIKEDSTSEDDKYINFMIQQESEWVFSNGHHDEKVWPHITGTVAVKRDGSHVDTIVDCLSTSLSSSDESYDSTARLIRFLPYWYRARTDYETALNVKFNTSEGDYFAIEYVAFFKNINKAINTNIFNILNTELLDVQGREIYLPKSSLSTNLSGMNPDEIGNVIIPGLCYAQYGSKYVYLHFIGDGKYSGVLSCTHQGSSVTYKVDTKGYAWTIDGSDRDIYSGVGFNLKLSENKSYRLHFEGRHYGDTTSTHICFLLQFDSGGNFLGATSRVIYQDNIMDFSTLEGATWGIILITRRDTIYTGNISDIYLYEKKEV